MPRHPFERLDRARLRSLAWLSSAGALTLGAALVALGRPLVVTDAPYGLLTFELAWRPERLEAVLAAWGEAGRARARLMTWLDYPYLASYGLALGTLSWLVPGAARLPGLARAAGWAGVTAAALDAVENAAALRLLAGGPARPWCVLQAACAAPKFLLAGLALAWMLAGAFIRAPRD